MIALIALHCIVIIIINCDDCIAVGCGSHQPAGVPADVDVIIVIINIIINIIIIIIFIIFIIIICHYHHHCIALQLGCGSRQPAEVPADLDGR